MAIAYFWYANALRITRPEGRVISDKPAPLTREQMAWVFRSLAYHENYKGQDIYVPLQDGTFIEMKAGEVLPRGAPHRAPRPDRMLAVRPVSLAALHHPSTNYSSGRSVSYTTDAGNCCNPAHLARLLVTATPRSRSLIRRNDGRGVCLACDARRHRQENEVAHEGLALHLRSARRRSRHVGRRVASWPNRELPEMRRQDMTLGKQIEEYERPYNVVYGTFGEEPNLVPGAEGQDWPIWRARMMVVALLKAQIDKLPPNDPERGALNQIRDEFQVALTGEVVWGMVRKWRNKHGIQRFIGLVERGKDYKEAGRQPTTPVGRSPRSVFPDAPTAPRPKAAEPNEAKRIADRMAKAARKAVDGDTNHH
jgi:hypothetical protein